MCVDRDAGRRWRLSDALERDDFFSSHPLQVLLLRAIFSENRFPPRIKSGAGFFKIAR